jgi:hypothetical protein
MKNVMFIHAGNLIVDKSGFPNADRCQKILDEISSYILESKIYEDLDFINLELVGDPNIRFDVPKSRINFNGEDARQWEFPTLLKIIEHSKNNPEDNILYIHTKGSSNHVGVSEYQWIEDVRNYHLYFNITKYKDSLEYLKEYDCCGVELIDDPVKHYSQNFWWTKASHVNTLTPPNELIPVFDYRHNCEFWICSNSHSKYKSKFNLYNHYIGAHDFSKNLYR